MIAAVFDCMVFLQAATSEQGPAFACLELVEANEVTLYLSSETAAAQHVIRYCVSRPTDRSADSLVPREALAGVR
jgi:hypothetical protein